MLQNVFEHEELTVFDYGTAVVLSPLLRVYLSDYPSKHTLIGHRRYTENADNEYNYVVAEYCPTQSFSANTVRMFTNAGILPPAVCVVDIETTGLEPHKDRVEKIGLLFSNYADVSGNKIPDYCVILEGEEEDILPVFIDIMEYVHGLVIGHNISEFDLPFLKTRWQRYRNLYDENDVLPDFPFKSRVSNFRVGMDEKQITRWQNNRCMVLDTMPLSQRFDVMTGGKAGGYGLKQLVYEWRLTDKKRTEKYYQTEDQLNYLVDDLSDTLNLFWFVSDWFYELFNFGSLTWFNAYDGLGRLVNTVFFTWLSWVQPVPKRQSEADTYVGGYVDLLHTGFFKNICSIDVVSMYPNIMKRFIKPKWDYAGYFPAIVSLLLDLRLKYKSENKEAKQKALKILINSMYGFLASGMNYSDAEQAKQVTEHGRNIIATMRDIIINSGGVVIEMDTDGIYFQHPDPEAVQKAIEETTGFKTELTRYDAGLFVRKKNYALWKDLSKPDEIILRGNSLRSRRDNAIYSNIVQGILKAYLTPDPTTAIRELWEKAFNEYYMYDLKTLPKAWYSGDREIPQSPPKNISERLDRIEKLFNVFGRFDTLSEVSEALEGERRPVWRKRIELEKQTVLGFGR